MSAPDKSNSKAPPSLLSNAGNGTDANGSRILANLEGRVEPQADAPRGSRAPLILVALLVLCVGSWGAWRVQRHVAAKPAEAVASGNVVVKAPAATAASAAASTTLAAASQASAPQAATIISDDSADKDGASTPAVADDNRLSRALADGADDANHASSAKPVAVAGAADAENGDHKSKKSTVAGSASSGKSHHESVPVHEKHELAKSSAHPANTKALAQSKKQEPGTRKREDADADLLAALVARTEPYDPKSPVGARTSKVSASTRPADSHLAEQVAACGKNGFFEEQLCRWRICDGHWGKDPSCPQADSRRP
ncbi:hypothetical protein [Paraburkholderia metrosideri]|uniref:Phage tail protein n=1 Tax=Paraburkholderia metrosideri TaxID=580937 RepID=A0ABN7I2B0_9BURK|nr:hypothetical protein [Paraburkholderia metrosideri]CAD6546094.1 hypothetical protein LMG28140_04278 [Paraburkholderia metrosideri]